MKESSETRVTVIFTPQEKIELKMMSILTKKTMSEFVRFVVKEKIKSLKMKS